MRLPSSSTFQIVATLKNTGDETLNLLNDPSSVLKKAPTNSFTIADHTGASPAFTGIVVKYAMNKAVEADKEISFTVLAPGTSWHVLTAPTHS
jgi:peptidyl-Lys metalloendopeptidase